MAGNAARELNATKRVLLAGSAILALGVPVIAGFLSSPLADEMQRRAEMMRVQISRVRPISLIRMSLSIPREICSQRQALPSRSIA